MNRRCLRSACMLFVVGAVIGAIAAPFIAQWVAAAAQPGVKHMAANATAWAWLSAKAALWIGCVFASVPITAHYCLRNDSSPRIVALLLCIALAVCGASVLYTRATIAAISPESLGLDVLIAAPSYSFIGPSLASAMAVIGVSLFLRTIPVSRDL